MATISERVDSFAIGFFQHDYLAKTSSYLHEEGETPEERAASLKNAWQMFDEFVAIAPVKSESGRQKTHEMQAAIANVKRDPTKANIAAFDKLALDFRGLILKYDVQGTKESIHDAYDTAETIIGLTILVLLILSIVIYRILRKAFLSITGDIKENIRRISRGDLTEEESHYREDINGIHSELDGMRGSLTHIASSMKTASSRIEHIAEEVAQGNQNLSVRTEQQVGALQLTAANMEQIKTAVEQNTDNARYGNTLAAKANEVAQTGAGIMTNVIDSMAKIDKSARQIAEINRVINGIANQTNILALNAAVEAARAGVQGRGFAVVASEVRNLARRSAEAADEIGSLIQGSMVNVNEGTLQVSEAGQAMNDIVSSIGQVSAIMKEISNASEEQSLGVNQVARALNEMDTGTQQNAALVVESSAITQEMNVQAKTLADIVEIFTFDEERVAVSSTPFAEHHAG
ncbi:MULTISPECIES: methyl-accepting chemotaxis protein [unclassified Enterobacter]|uniref:methyl-accepting chemotaxis protein n=1 Tax=unclassified Enterobacter TaxID=2608935 RepID=UPI00161F1666|nr:MULTISPECIES: methyl-accepting chemotaxis protein [unclassified Enterobacter]